MPRVHGIEIVPRRGRDCGRSRPLIAFGGVGGGGSANACVGESTSNGGGEGEGEGEGDGDGDGDGDGGDNGYAGNGGGSVRFSRETTSHALPLKVLAGGMDGESQCMPVGGVVESTRSNDDRAASPATASPPEAKSAGETKERPTSAAEIRTIESRTSAAGTVAAVADGVSIRPQAREILNHIEFGSHSFSVQEISRKNPPELNPDHSRLGSVGIGQSSALIDVLPQMMTTKSLAETTAQLMMSEDEAEESRPPEEFERVATKNSIYNCNAYWLYERCSAACIQMETPLSPLDLSIEILGFVRAIKDDDKFEATLHRKLFDVMKDGKRRDLDLIFDVIERALELREDATLDERSVQEFATCVGGFTNTNKANDGHSVDKEINANEAPVTEPIETSAVENIFTKSLENILSHKEQQEGSPRKMHRSRRKKHPTQNTSMAVNTRLHGVEEPSRAHGNSPTNEKLLATETDTVTNESVHADFPQMEDVLDMQDDEKWSFLPSAQRESIGECNEDIDQMSGRVTRSMGVAAVDVICGADDEEEHSPKIVRSLVLSGMEGEAEKTGDSDDEQDQSMNDNTDNFLAASAAELKKDYGLITKDQMDSMQNWDHRSQGEATDAASSRGNEHESEKPQASDDTPRDTEDSQIDGEHIFDLVKMRKRSEGKESVRVMFTGFTATRRHMQMIETIGAEYVESIEEAHTATHVIATDGTTALRRTPKLMICICRVAKILSIEWLEKSSKEQRILDTHDYLLLGDREAEKRYDFSMKETIRNGILARKRRGGVLGCWFVYICSGVAGNRAPHTKELHLIIEAGGGQVLKSLTNMKSFDPLKTIVLTSEPSTKSQLKERGVTKAESLGAKILSTSWLFHTIITQKLVHIDSEDDSDPAIDGSRTSRFVRSNSQELLESTISDLSLSPEIRVAIRSTRPTPTNIIVDQATIDRLHDVNSFRIRGSSVSHLQRAPPSSQKRGIMSSQKSSESITKTFYSHKSLVAPFEAISLSDDMAAAKTNELWTHFFNRVNMGASKTPPSNRPKRGIRCLRGRKRSISPLVASTNPIRMKAPNDVQKGNQQNSSFSATSRNIIFKDNPFVTWEAYVLFTLGLRAEERVHESSTSATIMPASNFFPRPVAINVDEKRNYHNQTLSSSNTLSLKVDARQHGLDKAWEIFGSLQDVFTLHQQHQTSGMIPEKVVALLSLQAIEAVAAVHAHGIVHNDIGLDSFLVVKRSHPSRSKTNKKHHNESEIGSWFLQVIGFGNKAVVLDCHAHHEDSDYAHDYQCLANVIHFFLTGGVEISLNTSRSGSVEFTSKAFIMGNLFLRGALSWCSLIDALMCVGELTPGRNESEGHFRLEYPFSVFNLAASDDRGDSRMDQFVWSCRILQDLADGKKLADFLNELCSYNSRFIHPDTNLSCFVSNTHDGRQSFACYTSNAQTVYQLMERECKLQADTSALAHREAELLEKLAQFEQSKSEHQSILARESECQIKENELRKREKAHAREVQRLETIKEDLHLRQRRLEQMLLLSDGVSKGSAPPKTKQVHSERPLGNNKAKTHLSEANDYWQLLAGEKTSQESTPSPRSIDSLPHQYSQSMQGESFLSPFLSLQNAEGLKRKKDVDLRSFSQGQSHGTDDLSQFENFHEESQESHGSASSMKRRKKGCFRKSPKCSLHNLPKSPTPKRQTPPKKVFIDFCEE